MQYKETPVAKIRLASHVKEIHGRTGNYIYYCVKGRQYARAYAKPRNPATGAQQACRTSFAEAVKMWQGLSRAEKEKYNRRSINRPYSGYNLFISMRLKNNIYERPEVKASVYVKYMIRINSVIHPSPQGNGSEYMPCHAARCKKPPG